MWVEGGEPIRLGAARGQLGEKTEAERSAAAAGFQLLNCAAAKNANSIPLLRSSLSQVPPFFRPRPTEFIEGRGRTDSSTRRAKINSTENTGRRGRMEGWNGKICRRRGKLDCGRRISGDGSTPIGYAQTEWINGRGGLF